MEVTLTGAKTKAAMYAVITTDDETNAFVNADGSARIKWASGRITDTTPIEKSTGRDTVSALVKVFEKAGYEPVVHLAPKNFASTDAAKLWFDSIGLEATCLQQ
jgi:hypothetical protein